MKLVLYVRKVFLDKGTFFPVRQKETHPFVKALEKNVDIPCQQVIIVRAGVKTPDYTNFTANK